MQNHSDFRLIGHRGAASLAPENTLASFHAAKKAGVSEVEFDVRLTKCGTPVVIHDGTLRRTHNIHRFVSRMGVRDLRLLEVPALDEVLDVLKILNLKAIVEVKACSPLAIVDIAKMCISGGHKLSSFDFKWIDQALTAQPSLVAQCLFQKLDERNPHSWPSAIKEQMVKEVAADINHISTDGVARARALGLSVLAYTVRSPQQMAYARSLMLDGVFVDNPVDAQRWLKNECKIFF